MPEVRPGDDLPTLLVRALTEGGLELGDGDVLAITQKVVSKAEGRLVAEGPGGKAGWVAHEARRIVARRGDLVIAETRHGFVCANAGVDASNVAEGFLTLLPEDPDGSAERVRSAMEAAFGVSIGVVVTDTFGRAWRQGLVNVAIGCAGLPAVIDLRGTKDATGRVLDVTVEALADEVAAAAGLVMGKAEGIPAAIVRGIRVEEPPLPASALVRPPEEDLFRQSPLETLRAQRASMAAPSRTFGPGDVPNAALQEAIRAAFAGVHPDEPAACLFVATRRGPARRRLLSALELGVAAAEDGAALREAPVVIVPFVRSPAPTSHQDHDRARSDRDAVMAVGGAAIQSTILGLHAQGLSSRWVRCTCSQAATRDAVGVGEEWIALGAIAIGPEPAVAPDHDLRASLPPDVDVERFLREIT
jgi:coenzyme F420-0:L-glutamate ligase/coenzyme F420-1:gamma-L-glutamate ligase